jgi:flagellin-like hook-associated protein FlgL
MIEQAKAVVQSAMSSDHSSGATTVSLTVGSVAAGETITLGGVTLTATNAGTPGTDQFYMGGTAEMDAIALAEAINGNTTLATAGYKATVDGDVVTISLTVAGTPTNVAVADTGGTAITNGNVTEATVAATTELSNLQAQYNTLRTQIDKLAQDSGYKGKNLLNGDTLDVIFEGATLTVTGFAADTTGLNISQAAWTTAGDIDTTLSAALTELDNALDTLSQQSSTLSSNLSIITVRQDFSTNMINTLTEGSDKLTLADTNEEGANMLMLQTRQSLATTALSLSAQAAQSVLKLFG